jgi:hypothetical protein
VWFDANNAKGPVSFSKRTLLHGVRAIPDTVTVSASNGTMNNEYLKGRESERLSANFTQGCYTGVFLDTEEKHGKPTWKAILTLILLTWRIW